METKFKIGDEVKVIRQGTSENSIGFIGKVADIYNIENDECRQYQIGEKKELGSNWSYESDLELVTEDFKRLVLKEGNMKTKKETPIKISRSLVNTYYEAATDTQKAYIVEHIKIDGSTTVEAIKGLYDIACHNWKPKIEANHPEVFKSTVKWDRSALNKDNKYHIGYKADSTLGAMGDIGIISKLVYTYKTKKEAENEAFLLNTIVAMRNWAKFHNEIDKFVADWDNGENWGVEVYGNEINIDYYSDSRAHLFQIVVSSKERAEEMSAEFKDDIQKLIDLKLI